MLKAALSSASSGQPQLVMLAGEPGIGKTSTAREFTEYSVSQGAEVLWGRCYESIGMPPYWPWIQAIRSYVRDHDSELLLSQMGTGAADIAEIVPEVRARFPDLEPSPGLDSPEQARVRLFDSITTFLKGASQLRPLVLVLDNLHWADRPSLLLLEFLAQELSEGQVLVLGAYRDQELSGDHPLSRTLGELTKENHFQRLRLRRLSAEDVRDLIELLAGTTPAQSLVDAVFSRTQGNPLFVTEVVRLLLQEAEPTRDGPLRNVSGDWGIPEGVREAISERLNRLSQICNLVLTTASVIGREFGLDQLERLHTDLSGQQILGMIEEALNARIIEEIPQFVGRYQFAHVLVQETLTSTLSATRRARMHREIGETLERLYASELTVHAAELADHFSQAEPGTADEKLVRYSRMAGERALATYAYEDALAHFQRGLAAREGRPPDEEWADLQFGLGQAQVAMLSLDEAMVSLSGAFDYYAQTGNVHRALVVAEHPLPAYAGRFRWASQLSAQALDLVPPDSHDAGRLLSNRVQLIGFEEANYEGAISAFQSALAIAQREKDAAMEMRTLANGAMVDLYHLRYQEGLDKSRKAIQMARQVDAPQVEAVAYYAAANFMLMLGESSLSRLHASAALAPAEKVRDRSWLSRILWANETVFFLKGDWEAARDFNDRARLTVWSRDPRTLFLRAALESGLGDFKSGDAYIEGLSDLVELAPPGPDIEHATLAITIPAVARITGTQDQFDVAERAAKTVLSAPSATPLMVLLSRVGLALIAVHQVDVAAASEQYSALQSTHGVMIWLISGDRVLALLAQTMGEQVTAMAHFEDAQAFCRKAGYRPELAWTCSDYAEALLRRNEPDDRAKAISLLDEALAVTEALRMEPLTERVIALRRSGEARSRPTPSLPDGLTQRELEVLRLIAAGSTNRMIAEKLVISVNTVERHVSNILSKCRSANRAEAVAYAARHGLVS